MDPYGRGALGRVYHAQRAHRGRQLEERLTAGDAWEDGQGTGLVYTRADARPPYAGAITHTFQKLLTQDGLPKVRFHDLRHTVATLLLAQCAAGGDGLHRGRPWQGAPSRFSELGQPLG